MIIDESIESIFISIWSHASPRLLAIKHGGSHMIQYKTTSIPNVPFKGVKIKEFEKGLTVATCNKAVAPIGQAIEAEGRGGWTLHSIECIPQKMCRKKTLFELLLGWIPILGNWMFPSMRQECKEGVDFGIYILVFSREE